MQSARLVGLGALVAVLAASPGLGKSTGLGYQGSLEALDKAGKRLGSCPLKHTDVKAEIAGFITRVTVRQQFHNPFPDKIEAVYVFPLSENAAVDRMTMTLGDRVIEGEVHERKEARRIYVAAKAAGHVASLLDQERPNVFTQSVANIEPGAEVDITISYGETLEWKDGLYGFVFPMVVGARYTPGTPAGPKGLGFAPPTDQVPDADRVTPKVTPAGTRAGHDISLTVTLDAGLPIRHLESKQHEIDVAYADREKTRAVVRLRNQKTIPNKDFVLEFQTSSDKIEDTLLTHTDQRGKFFTLVLQPPKRVRTEQVVPRELIFVIDKSGSMSGFPIETAKEAMRRCIEGLHPRDTFNLMTFEGGVGFCFDRPVPNTEANRKKAQEYLGNLRGGGGTGMMSAIHACLGGQDDPQRLRVVCFMTDGYVSNDAAIIEAVRKNAGRARVFSFGIGTSVNRYLLEGMARAGRGEVQFILNEAQIAGAAERFYERVSAPVLTDIQIDFGGMAVEEVFPKQTPDLFSVKPIVLKGRYKQGGKATITLRGKTGQGAFERKIEATLPDQEPQREVLAPLWARAKVDCLMERVPPTAAEGDPFGDQPRPSADPKVKKEITDLGIAYRLLTQFTSFVAVEKRRVVKDGKLQTVAVPVEMPAGVSRKGFGAEVYYDDNPVFVEAGGGAMGGLGGFRVNGAGGVGVGAGTGTSGAGFGGRGQGARQAMVGGFGGTKMSERTVAAGLNWLARRQNKDGSWSFDAAGADSPQYANPGKCPSKCGATALALLPFLAAGQTHETKGPYQQNIYRGLFWLTQKQKANGDLRGEGDSMVWQAIAATVLCETHGMTKDKMVGRAAQQAIGFIAAQQDAKTGGWAARPGEHPDVITTAWQALAMESGRLAGLHVDPAVLTRAAAMLDQCQSDGGAFYGRTVPGKDRDATAAGLLCRLHLHGRPNKGQDAGTRRPEMERRLTELLPVPPKEPAFGEAVQRGAAYLVTEGPSKQDIVYDLFATMFLHRISGPQWDEWNRRMRKLLIESQVREGPETGSWCLAEESHAAEGGRLFQTAVGLLTLEVYYRYLPLYKEPPAE